MPRTFKNTSTRHPILKCISYQNFRKKYNNSNDIIYKSIWYLCQSPQSQRPNIAYKNHKTTDIANLLLQICILLFSVFSALGFTDSVYATPALQCTTPTTGIDVSCCIYRNG